MVANEKDIALWLLANSKLSSSDRWTALRRAIKEAMKSLKFLEINWPKTCNGAVGMLNTIPEEHYQAVIQHINGSINQDPAASAVPAASLAAAAAAGGAGALPTITAESPSALDDEV